MGKLVFLIIYYFQIVTKDIFSIIDLNTVAKKVAERKYKTLNELICDMTLIIENCRYYNSHESQFYKFAGILELFFVTKLRQIRDKFCEQYLKA